MTRLSRLLPFVGLLLVLASSANAQSGCGGQAPALTYCGNNTGSLALPGWKLLSGIPLPSIAGGTVLGNRGTSSATASPLTNPILGIPGTSTGEIGFAGITSGTATVKAQPAAGTPTLLLPTGSGTLASTAASPLVLSATTGALTCPTCVTSSGGGAISGTAPILVSAAGVVSINAPYSTITSPVSGGMPYFNSTTTIASSGLLAANQIVLGGGAGAAPATLGSLGTTTTVLHGNAAGGPTFGPVVNADLTNSSLTIGSTNIALGATSTTLAGLTSVTSTTFIGALTGHASLDLALTGGTMSGAIAMGGNDITGGGNATFTGITGTTFNKVSIPAPATAATINMSNNKTLTINNSIQLIGTDGTSWTGPTTSAILARTDAGQTFTGTQAFGALTAATVAASTSVVATSASATCLAAGLNGTSNAAFVVDCSAASQAAGFRVVGAASGGTINLLTTDSGSNNNLAFNAKGTGTISFGTVSTGNIIFTPDVSLGGQYFQPSITTTSAAQTGTVCWTTGTGKFTVDTTVGCLTSIIAAKNVTEHLNSSAALDLVLRLDPFAFRYKSGWGDSGRYEQFGLGAEQVALIDERLVGRDPDGALQGVRYQELTAVLAGAIKELKADNDNLRADIEALQKRAVTP